MSHLLKLNWVFRTQRRYADGKKYYENHSFYKKKIFNTTLLSSYIKGVCFVTMKIKDIVMVCCYRVEEDMKIAGSCHFHVSNDKI